MISPGRDEHKKYLKPPPSYDSDDDFPTVNQGLNMHAPRYIYLHLTTIEATIHG